MVISPRRQDERLNGAQSRGAVLDKVARLESLSINGKASFHRARDPGRPGSARLTGHRQGLGANPAGFESRYFVFASLGWILVSSPAGGRAEYAAQLRR